jgi:hypothetical protein
MGVIDKQPAVKQQIQVILKRKDVADDQKVSLIAQLLQRTSNKK